MLKSIRLEAVRPDHLAELYQWATAPGSAFRWRFGGTTPSPDHFRDAAWSGVLCQFLAVDASGTHHGLVVCYGADHANGHAYWAVQGNPSRATGVGTMVGMLLLVDHVFRHWAFRKLYAEVASYNESEFANALRRYTQTEGVLVDHIYHDGRYWDQTTYALYRNDWIENIRPIFAQLLGERNPEAS